MDGIVTLPPWMWSNEHKAVVEILRRGHFPSTVMVRLPDDRELEVDIITLERNK